MAQFEIQDLLYLMARLRKPETGCPWDIAQTYQTVAPYTLEEAYEVVDAIDRNDLTHLREELGDLLFQVVFYSQMGKEEGAFTFADVVHSITEKLVRRHPHVFPEGTLESEVNSNNRTATASVNAKWESLKQNERESKGFNSILADVPMALPALKRAQKLQKRAAKVGFDWDQPEQVFQQFENEVEELHHAIANETQADQLQEFGDVLFSIVNWGRHLGFDAEEALRLANNKFVKRFEYIEQQCAQSDTALTKENLAVMETYWQQAKTAASEQS